MATRSGSLLYSASLFSTSSVYVGGSNSGNSGFYVQSRVFMMRGVSNVNGQTYYWTSYFPDVSGSNAPITGSWNNSVVVGIRTF